MGTFGAQRLRRSAFSSKRARQSVETIETVLGRTIGGNTGNNTPSQETLAKRTVEQDSKRGLDQTKKQ